MTTLTVAEVCRRYLDSIKNGSPETYRLRTNYLTQLCSSYGERCAMILTRQDLTRWIKAHPGWKDGRVALQSVRRALNYCVEAGSISENPIKGWKIPKSGHRVAYIFPEIEAAVARYARPALALFVKVCIRTGARPDVEFAHLEARHVEESPKGQRWRFPANETKGGKRDRIIYVAEDIAEIVRTLSKAGGRVFRDEQGRPWTNVTLRGAFYRLKKLLRKRGITPDEPFVAYTCRHTYANRLLNGFWGSTVTLEVLAGLMGTTLTTCVQHYTQWSEPNADALWAATNPMGDQT